MNIDFALLLVVLVGVSGLIWLLDTLLLKRPRDRAVEEYLRGKPVSDPDNDPAIASLRREPVIVEYAKSFFPVLLVVLILRSFVLEPYQVPTGSMIPTIKVGDFILVNKYAYGLRLPVLGTKFLDIGDPERGDVMVFIPPIADQYYVKRVIGLPGDRIRYEGKTLFINGEEIPTEFVGPVEIEFETPSGEVVLPGSLYREEIGDTEHEIQLADTRQNNFPRTSWIVPDGHYFMMGDNRDNSADSREWNTVSETKIIGKAVAVWLHKDPGWNLPNFSGNRLIK